MSADDLVSKILNLQSVLSADPRINNVPLPNDSVLTYEFSARSYLCNAFPGFTWRNGHWYKITPELKFMPMSGNSLKNALDYRAHVLSQNHSEKIDKTIYINDSYLPILVHGTRYFVRVCVNKPSHNRDTIKNTFMYIYIPSMQGVMRVPQNSEYGNILEFGKFEDPNDQKKIPTSYVEYMEIQGRP